MGYPDCYPYNQSDDSVRIRNSKLKELKAEIKRTEKMVNSESKKVKLKKLKASYQLWWGS